MEDDIWYCRGEEDRMTARDEGWTLPSSPMAAEDEDEDSRLTPPPVTEVVKAPPLMRFVASWDKALGGPVADEGGEHGQT